MKSAKRIAVRAAALITICISSPIPAQGSDLPSETTDVAEGGDTLTIAPYFWLPDISGSVSLGGMSVPVNLSGTAILSDVESGGMAYARWHRGDHFFYLDTTFVDYHDPRSPLFFAQQADATVVVGEIGGGPVINAGVGENLLLDVAPYMGVRFTHVNAEVSGPLVNFSASNEWLDPMAGILMEMPVANNLRLISKLEAGGLVISDNDYYSALAVIDYRFAARWTLSGGYRWSRGRYRSQAGLNASLTGHGPLIGVTYSVPLP